jgi:hypothetical protein
MKADAALSVRIWDCNFNGIVFGWIAFSHP